MSELCHVWGQTTRWERATGGGVKPYGQVMADAIRHPKVRAVQSWRTDADKTHLVSRAWWCTPAIPALGKLRREGQHRLEASLGSIASSRPA